MASTAAGVAMGSTIGHTVGGIITHGLFGSSDRGEVSSSYPTDSTMMSSKVHPLRQLYRHQILVEFALSNRNN